MTWGFKGEGDRGLELPAGSLVGPSPEDRARIRYNERNRLLEQSTDGAPYSPLVGSGGDPALLSAPDVYVDPATGSDDNDGLTPATALATLGEYAQRMGNGIPAVSQTVNILGDLTEDVDLRVRVPADVTLQGQRTVLFSGTVTSATALDTSTSPVTRGEVTDAGVVWTSAGPGGTSLVGKMIVLTGGAHAGKISFILEDQGGGSGTFNTNTFIDPLTFATGFPSAGDTFDVVDLTKITGVFKVQNDAIAGQGGTVHLQDIELTNVGGAAFYITGGFSAFNCILGGTTHASEIKHSDFQFNGVLFTARSVAYTECGTTGHFGCSFRDSRTIVTNCSAGFGLNNVAQYVSGGVQGTSPSFATGHGGRIDIAGGSLGVYDQVASSTVIDIAPGSRCRVRSSGLIWSIGQTAGIGCDIDSNGMASWQTGSVASDGYDFDVSGPAVEFDVGGTTTTAAALGAAGTINGANNAMAIPADT